MIGDIFEGAVRFGASYIGGRKRLEERAQAQEAYDASMANYFGQDTSNLYANMQNTMEDLTVNTQAAQFMAQQQQQGLANTMEGLRGAAGGSGIAALAQSLAAQQAENMAKASASIGQQEAANRMATAKQAGVLQQLELKGAEQSRALEADLMGQRFQIDAYDLAAREKAIQDARAARMEGLGQLTGGIGNVVAGKSIGDLKDMLGMGGGGTTTGATTSTLMQAPQAPQLQTGSFQVPGLTLPPASYLFGNVSGGVGDGLKYLPYPDDTGDLPVMYQNPLR